VASGVDASLAGEERMPVSANSPLVNSGPKWQTPAVALADEDLQAALRGQRIVV